VDENVQERLFCCSTSSDKMHLCLLLVGHTGDHRCCTCEEVWA
jgi:hypothetical protein